MRSRLATPRTDPARIIGPVILALLVIATILVVRQDSGADVALSPGTADSQESSSPMGSIGDLLPDTVTEGESGVSTPAVAATPGGEVDAGGTTAPVPGSAVPGAAAPGPSASGATAPGQEPQAPDAAGTAAGAPTAAGTGPADPAPAAAGRPDITPGTCFDGSGLTTADLEIVPCEQLHGNEVYVVMNASGEPGSPYPGETALRDEVNPICRGDAFTEYVGIEWGQSRFFTSSMVPTEAAWNSGDRLTGCYLYDLRSSREGSARGSMM